MPKRIRFDYNITDDKWVPAAAKNLDIADFTVEELYLPHDFEGNTTIGIKTRKIVGNKIIEQNSTPTFEWDKHSFHITILKEDYEEITPIQGQIYFVYEEGEPIR